MGKILYFKTMHVYVNRSSRSNMDDCHFLLSMKHYKWQHKIVSGFFSPNIKDKNVLNIFDKSKIKLLQNYSQEWLGKFKTNRKKIELYLFNITPLFS